MSAPPKKNRPLKKTNPAPASNGAKTDWTNLPPDGPLEQALVQCVFSDPLEASPLLPGDAKELFADHRHRLLFVAAMDLAESGDLCAPPTIKSLLQSRNELFDGAPELIDHFFKECGVPSAAGYYAGKLRPLYERRCQIESAKRVEMAVRNGDAEDISDAIKALTRCSPWKTRIQARSLWDLQGRQENNPTELLRHNFLSVAGALLVVAPAGIGKSVFESQCAMAWGAGLPTLAIEPSRPLKSLIIQAEDDDGDRAEMRDGIIEGLNLTPTQIERAKGNVFIHQESTHTGEAFFIEVVEPLLALHKPDLLWINPLLAFLGGDVSDQPLVSKFLRNWLNPLLIEHQCAAVVIHHTNKPSNGKEKPSWSAGDFAYFGSGSAELANWARAVLAIRSIGSHDVFSLYAGKRGQRLRWTKADGLRSMERHIGHSDKAGIIYWRDVDDSEVSKPKATADAILALVPRDGKIERSKLQMEAQAGGFGRDRVRLMIDELLDTQRLFEMKEKRSGGRDRIFISRYQP